MDLGVGGFDAGIEYQLQTPPVSAPDNCLCCLALRLVNLSLREVEEMILERGMNVSYGPIRRWTIKFGPLIAHVLRRRQPRSGDVWHLGEVVLNSADRSYWL